MNIKKLLAVGITLLFIGVAFAPSITADNPSINNTIYVDDDATFPFLGTEEHPFKYIQSGINAAFNGDTVVVKDGTYTNHITVDKPIILIAANDRVTISVVNKEYNDAAICVSGYNVTIARFNIGVSGGYGIEVEGAYHFITDNKITGASTGIAVYDADYSIISRNKVSFAEKGIWIYHGKYNEVIDNIIMGCECGIHIGGYMALNVKNEVTYNNIIANVAGLYIAGVKGPTKVMHNNFVCNIRDAFFYGISTIWFHNYWGKPRLLPKLIFGRVYFCPWISFDLRPALFRQTKNW